MTTRGRGAALILLLAMLAGCGSAPAGADGDLVDDWPAPVAPSMYPVAAGDCWTGEIRSGWNLRSGELRRKVACTDPHDTETLHTAPPADRTPETAFDLCTRAAEDFLGGEWRDGRVHVQPFSRPTGELRCDIAEVRSIRGEIVRRTGTLRDGLRGTRPLATGCITVSDEVDHLNQPELIEPVACTERHAGEYAGLYVAPPGNPPVGDESYQRLYSGCPPIVAAYVGMTEAQLLAHDQIGWAPYWRGTQVWGDGDRGVLCFATVPDTRGSVKGFGNRRLPRG